MREKLLTAFTLLLVPGVSSALVDQKSNLGVTVHVEPVVYQAPAKTKVVEPGTSAAHFFDVTVGAFEPVQLRSDFLLRSQPQKEGSRRLMSVGAAILQDGIFLTGNTRTTVEPNGLSGEWVEVFLHDSTAWVSRDAVVGKLPFASGKLVPLPPKRPVELVVKPQTKPSIAIVAEAEKPKRLPAARTITPPVAALSLSTPSCVTSYGEFQKNPRFQKALGGTNPFTNWLGPMGATIELGTHGPAVLHHPWKGAIPLNVSLCLDRQNTPYIGVNGSTVYFEGPGFAKVSIADPDSQQKYSFTRSTQ